MSLFLRLSCYFLYLWQIRLMVAPLVHDINESNVVPEQFVPERLKSLLIQVKDHLQQVNRRIEELLSGDGAF